MIKTSRWMPFLLGCIVCGVAPAHADTVTITYSSGKVQTITLDERLEQVTDVSLRRSPAAGTEKKERVEAQSKGGDAEVTSRKPGATIYWAPPIEE